MTLSIGIALGALVERRIAAAIARGEFDDLPGAGKPLALDDDPLVPEDMRVALRVLKIAGFVPPELTQVREVNQLLGALARGDLCESERSTGRRRLRALLIQLEFAGRPATAAAAWQQYGEVLRNRCSEP